MDATDLESKQYKSNLLTYTVDEGSLLNMNKVFALVILLVCLVSGCETIRQKTSGPEFEDAKLTAIIKETMRAGATLE